MPRKWQIIFPIKKAIAKAMKKTNQESLWSICTSHQDNPLAPAHISINSNQLKNFFM